MAVYTTQQIALPLPKGKTVSVEAHAYKNSGLAYHPYLAGGTADAPIFSERFSTVSHVASGLALVNCQTVGKARAAIKSLVESDIDWTQPLEALTRDTQEYRRIKEVVREIQDNYR